MSSIDKIYFDENMNTHFIKKYISQTAIGYSFDLEYIRLRCVVEFSDGAVEEIIEEREIPKMRRGVDNG